MKKNYDIIIIGSGSIGTPLSFYLSKEKLSVLVIEKEASPGRGQNKAAIGGVRATHSEFSKIKLGLSSINELSNFKKNYNIDIDWFQGGYLYPIYSENDKKTVLDLLKKQQNAGLNIKWITKEEIKELVPQIETDNLLGGSYSPEDGNCSPLKTNFSYYKLAHKKGVDFSFNTLACSLLFSDDKSKVLGVKTNRGDFYSNYVLNCTGINLNDLHEKLNIQIPIKPDLHEAGITEPVKKWFNPLVVDIRGYPGSKNFYFYQNNEGQIIFCLTPEPPIYQSSNLPTYSFMTLSANRFLKILPVISNLRIRRTWRGYYPNSPDGLPIVEQIFDNYIVIGGFCGQGFMFGPGIAILILKKLTDKLNNEDKKILNELSLKRDFSKIEFFK